MTIFHGTFHLKMNLINTHIQHTDTSVGNTTRTFISINQAPIINNASSGAILSHRLIPNKVTRTEYEIKSPLLSLLSDRMCVRSRIRVRVARDKLAHSRLADYLVVSHVQWALNSRSRVRQKRIVGSRPRRPR